MPTQPQTRFSFSFVFLGLQSVTACLADASSNKLGRDPRFCGTVRARNFTVARIYNTRQPCCIRPRTLKSLFASFFVLAAFVPVFSRRSFVAPVPVSLPLLRGYRCPLRFLSRRRVRVSCVLPSVNTRCSFLVSCLYVPSVYFVCRLRRSVCASCPSVCLLSLIHI